MDDLILAIDAGTTGITALVVDRDARVIARGYREFPQHFPADGQVEHDLGEMWAATLASVTTALDELEAGRAGQPGVEQEQVGGRGRDAREGRLDVPARRELVARGAEADVEHAQRARIGVDEEETLLDQRALGSWGRNSADRDRLWSRAMQTMFPLPRRGAGRPRNLTDT